MLDSIEKSIIATICYYDILDYPLTGFEIYRYLVNVDKTAENIKDVSFYNIMNILENSSELKKIISQKNGFYFLKGREGIIKKHIWRKKIADGKWKKARRIIWLLQIIPFIRMIAMSGSLALGNPHRKSDLDLLIVAKVGRIWTCRTLITIFTTLLGVRRHGNVTRDKICLNHYIIDKSLEIPFRSLYNAQSYARLVPIIDKDGFIFRRFQRENSWIEDYLIFWPESRRRNVRWLHSGPDIHQDKLHPVEPLVQDEIYTSAPQPRSARTMEPAGRSPTKNLRTIRESKILTIIAKFLEILLSGKIGSFLEKFLAKYEKAHIEKDPLKEKPGGRIVANDTQLEFHPESPETGIIRGFNKRMRKLGFNQLACQKDSGLVK